MARAVRPIWSVRYVGPCHRAAAINCGQPYGRLPPFNWRRLGCQRRSPGALSTLLSRCMDPLRSEGKSCYDARFREPDPSHPTPRDLQRIAELRRVREQKVLRGRAAPRLRPAARRRSTRLPRTWSRTHLAAAHQCVSGQALESERESLMPVTCVSRTASHRHQGCRGWA
jgi:hypothetical protein